MVQVMTIVYLKKSGNITAISDGVQSMDMYGEDKESYMDIMDIMIVPKDSFIKDNISKFKIIDGELILMESRTTTYKEV